MKMFQYARNSPKRGPADFSRLTERWYRFAKWLGGDPVSVSTNCADCAILFATADSSLHLRQSGRWWIVDTVDDRGHRRNDTARFSTFDLAEKYLIWDWMSIAYTPIGKPSLWPRLYSRGFNPHVKSIALTNGRVELRSEDGRALLTEPDAKIFSHLMLESLAEIERIITTGVE
ncbi:hypothetical protein [Mycobacterium sp. E735]|uniref:hypothetical protein n=1 Tax=Mycobacterium sp. E735 TaxID=1834148 RepID=UPI0012EAE04F|nr:hypothetical protein [Mycobacterium sp. E735]